MKTFITLLFLALVVAFPGLQAQVNTYPYLQTGSNPIGWNVIQVVPVWNFGVVGVNPAGKTNDTAVVCQFFAYGVGSSGRIISPRFDLSSVSKPVVHFYIAHRSYNTENDSLIIEVSTNNGATFVDTPVPYKKAFISTPSLATMPSSTTYYIPSAANQWRQEVLDLSPYAGVSNLIISFRGISGFGNNLWIDDFTVYDAASVCNTNVTAPGSFNCNGFVTVNMSSIGNPSGGNLSVVNHLYTDPIPSFSNPKIATNSTATTQDGSIFTPNIVSPDQWFTVAYTGNDRFGFANYSISVDVSSYASLFDITKIYIVKRASLSGPWVCLNTTASGSVVTASGLSSFSDFGIAGDSLQNPLPVELTSFVSAVSGRNVELKWTTSSELNNSSFDIERSSATGEWSKVGYVAGRGTVSSATSYAFVDRSVSSGTYNYRLKQVDFNGNFEYFELGNEVTIGVPGEFALSQNYPNPFNPSTTIDFDVPFDAKIQLAVFDMSGKEVAVLVSENRSAGYHSVSFNASGISSGVYFYRLRAESEGKSYSATKKMMLVK